MTKEQLVAYAQVLVEKKALDLDCTKFKALCQAQFGQMSPEDEQALIDLTAEMEAERG